MPSFSPLYPSCISTILNFGSKGGNLGKETEIRKRKLGTRVQEQKKGHDGR